MGCAERERLTRWLLDSAGPVIRYRTAIESQGDPAAPLARRARAELLRSDNVRLWLGRLAFGRIHNGKNTDFENVVGKLLEFGLRAGIRPLDEGLAPYRRWVAGQIDRRHMLRQLDVSIVLAASLRAGCRDAALKALLLSRLEEIDCLAATRSFDIYADTAGWRGIPKGFVGRPFVKPELNRVLPYVHDLYALSAVPREWRTADVRRRIDRVVGYLLAPGYQSLPYGYGCLREDCGGRPRYYALGWSVHLPLYGRGTMSARHAAMLVQRVELMAHFPVAVRHPWFRRCMEHLGRFRTPDGTYRFPGPYLQEKREGYWVTGAHMGLEEGRRTPQVLEIESTFRMLRIARLAEGPNEA